MKKLLLAATVLAALAAVAVYFLRKQSKSEAWVEEFSVEEEIF